MGHFISMSYFATNSLGVKIIQLQIHSDHHDVICTKQQSKNLKQQTLCQIKPLELQIAQHHFNSKTIYKKQRIPAKKWGDTEIAERGRSVLVMRARYRSAGLIPHQRGWTDAG